VILSYTNLSKDLKKKWPRLKSTWFGQKEYYIPLTVEVAHMVQQHSVADMHYRNTTNECENYALFLWANIKKALVIEAELYYNMSITVPDKYKYTWALGFAMGLNFKHLLFNNGSHALNICRTKEGIILIDPQSDKIIIPSYSKKAKDGDFVYFTMM